MFTMGRKVIYANYTEEQLLKGTKEEIDNKILDILTNAIPTHAVNRNEILYLQNFLYGSQDISTKEKQTRKEINNKSVENWAHCLEDFKATFLLGKPIQYASANDISKEEISQLNKYNSYEDKHFLDLETYEDLWTVGRSYRYIQGSKITDEDEAPYDLVNLDVENTEVVYSSNAKHEQLLSFVETSKRYIIQEVDPNTGEKKHVPKNYNEYTVYTRKTQYTINDKSGQLKIIDRKPILHNEHSVIEYYFNRRRMSDLEFIKDILNDINYVENLDLDDIEQFVNSIMVFTNAEVSKSEIEQIKEMGAVSIASSDNKKASVEILQSRLKSLDTQIFYLRKLSALHTIINVPQATNNGDVSNAETGKAFLTGQGFTSASIRVEGEEQKFKKCDRKLLKVILKICKGTSRSGIKNLKVSDIESKFSRDLSDNLLNKTQALLNLTTANIPPSIRNTVIGLFSDPNSVTKLQEQYEKELKETEKQLKKLQNNDIQEQNNVLSKAQNNDIQEQ